MLVADKPSEQGDGMLLTQVCGQHLRCREIHLFPNIEFRWVPYHQMAKAAKIHPTINTSNDPLEG
jgi:hypothetical protein